MLSSPTFLSFDFLIFIAFHAITIEPYKGKLFDDNFFNIIIILLKKSGPYKNITDYIVHQIVVWLNWWENVYLFMIFHGFPMRVTVSPTTRQTLLKMTFMSGCEVLSGNNYIFFSVYLSMKLMKISVYRFIVRFPHIGVVNR